MHNIITIGEFNLISYSKDGCYKSFINSALNSKNNFILGYLNYFTYRYYLKINFPKSNIPVFFIPDGIGIFIILRIIYCVYVKFKNRIVSTDFWSEVLKMANAKKCRCVIWGGKQNMSSSVDGYFKYHYPGINVYKIYNGYSNDLKINDLNEIELLILGLGTPKQEQWIIENYKLLNVSLILMVGSAIDYWSGAKKRAPLWMQNIGLEWLHRLFQEPQRLWKRYILGIPVFLFYVIVQKVKFILKK